MPLLECTKNIIARVEEVTGRPVYVTEDASLSVLAHIQVARGDAPLHMLRYKPMGGRQPDYFIVYECGFVLRLYASPPEERRDLETSPDGIEKMGNVLGRLRGTPAFKAVFDTLLNGLGTQLRSVPIGLRIDQWILGGIHELKDLQAEGVRKQLADNIKVLDPEVKKATPAKVFGASTAMSAALAAFWAREWCDDTVTLPYKMAGLLDKGLRLLAIADEMSDKPTDDCSLVSC